MPLTQANRSSRESSWFWRGVRTLVGAAVLGLLVATVAPFARGAMPLLGLFEHFSAQLGAAALLGFIVTLLLGMRRWMVVALALIVWHGIALFPFLPSPAASEVAAAGAPPPLKVLSLNLWYMSEQRPETVSYLLGSGADVVGTVETTNEWRRDLEALQTVYPYHVDCVGKVFRCGVALFSKLPITDSFADRIDGKLPTVVWAKLEWQGVPITVAELQMINPLIGLREGFQMQQEATAAAYFKTLPGDLVVMGDFNSAPWSGLQRDFRAVSGLDNRGRLAFTWPTWAPAAFRLPIDQIFTRGGIGARDVRPGPAVGSDHLPILGEIFRTAP